MDWKQWSDSTSIIFKLGYLILACFGFFLRGFLGRVFTGQGYEIEKDAIIASIILGTALWLMVFRLFFLAVLFGAFMFTGQRMTNKMKWVQFSCMGCSPVILWEEFLD